MFGNMIKSLFFARGLQYALIRNKCYSPQVIRPLNCVRSLTQNFYAPKNQSPKCSTTREISGFRLLTTSSIHHEESGANEDPEQPAKLIDPRKDRSKVIPVEVSIRYMKSKAYHTTYGDDPIWTKYRRNFKGPYPPRLTRRSCIIRNEIRTGNPCPICRDEYLVIHYTNIELLKQFICPYTGEVLTGNKGGLCRKKQLELEIAIAKAKHYGLITFEVPFREYDYSEFYPQLRNSK